jgi:hypothetical protein
MLRGVVPGQIAAFKVIYNDWDNGVRIFRYTIPDSDVPESTTLLAERITGRYRCYQVVTRTDALIRLRCPDGAAQHWWSYNYEFHVCNGGLTVVGMSVGNRMRADLLARYERIAAQAAAQACKHL